MDLQELLLTALRTVGIYVLLLVLLRILGKKTVGNFTAFDLIVAFMLGELVDEPIFGDIPYVQGVLAITAVAALHFLNSFLAYHSPKFDELTGGKPRVLVKDGQMQHDAMASEHVNEQELWAMLREQQIDQLDEVKTGTLEINGILSVIKTEDAKALQKRDIQELLDSKKG